MYHHEEHPVPHFHVFHGGKDFSIGIESRVAFSGELPPSVRRHVMRWAEAKEHELMVNWQLARASGTLLPIDSLP